jgi:hypothetical protein
MKTKEKAIRVRQDDLSVLNDWLEMGWKVKNTCAFGPSPTLNYSYILVILEREKLSHE